MANIRREIYLSRYFEPVVMPLVQNTNDVIMEFHFADYTLPSGCTTQIYVQKTSTLIYNAGTINNTTNTVTFPTTTQMTAETGTKPAQIRIIKSGTVLQSFAFNIVVFPSIISDSAVQSSNEYTALVQAMTQLQNPVSTHKETAIPSNANLNDYTTAGNYYCGTVAIAETLTNAPWTDRNFTLIVMQGAAWASADIRIRQIAISAALTGEVFAARFYGGSWGDWCYVEASTNSKRELWFDYFLSSDISNDADNLLNGWAIGVNGTTANLPAAANGTLVSLGNSTAIQAELYTRHSSSNAEIFMRKKQSGTWGSWVSLNGFQTRYYALTVDGTTLYGGRYYSFTTTGLRCALPDPGAYLITLRIVATVGASVTNVRTGLATSITESGTATFLETYPASLNYNACAGGSGKMTSQYSAICLATSADSLIAATPVIYGYPASGTQTAAYGVTPLACSVTITKLSTNSTYTSDME